MQRAVLLKKQPPFARRYGILLPIFSLPGPYGIGTLGSSAFLFVDFLARAGAAYWQLLPLGPTGYGDSPYQSFSSFAGNPYFIDPELLYRQDKLTKAELQTAQAEPGEINYLKLYQTREALLYRAFLRAQKKDLPGYDEFLWQNRDWLTNYAEYTALKRHFSNKGRGALPYPVKTAEAEAFVKQHLKKQTAFVCYEQYEFFAQFCALKSYAESKGVQFIGDLPLYTANDSADVWANPELFCLNQNGSPTAVAGVPPDEFSKTGQLWGNPLYNWPAHESTGFSWWCSRVARQFSLYHILRIDHFIGISRYYAIPAGAENAQNGKWLPGPDKALIAALQKAVPNGRYIAEDLGLLNPKTAALIQKTGFPGMRLLQSAFNSGSSNGNLPHRLPKNCVLYTGTHDNNTLQGRILSFTPAEKRYAYRYLGVKRRADLQPRLIRVGFAATPDLFILPLQDLLGLGASARINTPATLGQNWRWRLTELPPNLLADETAALAAIFERSNLSDSEH